MAIAILLSVMVGIIVGLRHRVLVLVPIIIVAMAVAAAANIDKGLSAIVLAAILGAAAAQLGYLCGSAGSTLGQETPQPIANELAPSAKVSPTRLQASQRPILMRR